MTERTDPVTGEAPAPSTHPASTGLLASLRQNKEFERFWKFAVVGVIGAVIDYGTFTTLNALGVLDEVVWRLPLNLSITGLGISGGIAFVLAVISNFIWNRYWTYPDSRSKPIAWQLVTFFAVNVVGIIIRIPIIEIGHRPLGELAAGIVPSLGAGTVEWLGETLAWGIAVVLVMFWNFFVNRYWTYNDVD